MKKFLLVVFSLFAAGIINAQTRDEQAVEVHFGAYDKSGGGGVNYIWGTRYVTKMQSSRKNATIFPTRLLLKYVRLPVGHQYVMPTYGLQVLSGA